MADGEIAIDDPRNADVQELLSQHLAFANLHTPPAEIHALDVDGLLVPAVTLFSFRRGGRVLGVGALKQLDTNHVELKSMHTSASARGVGVGRALLDHLIGVARSRGTSQVSLETGSMAAYIPARTMYATAGFQLCEPYGDYLPSPSSVYMTLSLIAT